MLTSASSPIIGPETHPDGDSGGGSGAVTSPCGGGPQPTPNQPGSDRVNVKNNTLVILNSSTCTLKLQSTGSGPFSQKKKAHSLHQHNSSTYTVQFNKETTKTTTTSSEVQLVGSPAPPLTNSIMSSEDMGMAMTSVNFSTRKNSIVAITNDNTSSAGSIHGRPPEGADDLPAGQTAGSGVKSSSSRPCCFCWCCCCSCSWIRRRCLSVKAPNGSLEPTEPIRDEDIGQLSATEVKSWGDAFERLMGSDSGRKVFRAFLRCEYSEENILFWLACEDLKKERSPEVVEEKARVIYEDYVSILSPREVSLDSRVREIINRNMIAPSQHTFDEAQLQIYTLMHRDSYPRFVNSPTYKNMLRTVGVEPPESSASS